MSEKKKASKKQLLNRLRRVEGQIRGLQRLVDENKPCAEILVQMAAARSALDEVGVRLIAFGMKDCLEEQEENCEESVEKAIQLFIKYSQYVR